MSLYAQYAALLDGVLDDLVAEGALRAGLDRKNVTVEPPRDPAHGDLATNAAMVLAKPAASRMRARLSPTTAPRQCPMCSGPVGLAETYSTLTRSLPPMVETP